MQFLLQPFFERRQEPSRFLCIGVIQVYDAAPLMCEDQQHKQHLVGDRWDCMLMGEGLSDKMKTSHLLAG
jgi:hypothetical protein